MNPAAEVDWRWPAQRWRWVITGLIFLQVFLIYFLSSPERPVRRPVRLASFRSIPPDLADDLAAVLPEDPTLLAYAKPRGFSGAAWLAYPRFTYLQSNWNEMPAWLQLDPAHLTEPLRSALQSSPPPPEAHLGRALPAFHYPSFQTDPSRFRSRATIDGEVAARPLRTPLNPPVQAFTDVLTNSVVQIGIDQEGFPGVVRLLAGSGSRKADEDAISLARSLRFDPVPRREAIPEARFVDWTWGKITIQWFTAGAAAPPR